MGSRRFLPVRLANGKMIKPECFSREWLQSRADALKSRDVKTFEKCVLALELVGRLRQAGLEFVFKGGTALVLHFEPIRRLSIDVDILCLEPMERLKETLDTAAKDRPPFLGSEHQERRDREVPPTKHFKVAYDSAYDSGSRNSIQLDVITAEDPYAELESRAIDPSFLDLEEEVEVPIPTASCLLADKLAAFAPSTIGYPYRPVVAATGAPTDPRPMKVVKHLFDVGELAGVTVDLSQTIQTYHRIHEEQRKYRGGEWSLEDTLTDTQDASFWVCRIDGRPKENHERIDFFRQGIRSLDSHLFTQPFKRAESRLAAARAALAAELIRIGRTDFDLAEFVATDPGIESLRNAQLEGQWSNLNRLKQTDIKAFECWNLAQALRRGLR